MTAPAQTFDEDTGGVLVLRALVSNTGPRLDGVDDAVTWCAQVCDPASPLVGLYAFGDTLAGAREALAVAAWAAVNEGELTPCGIALTDLAGIRVEVASADVRSRLARHGRCRLNRTSCPCPESPSQTAQTQASVSALSAPSTPSSDLIPAASAAPPLSRSLLFCVLTREWDQIGGA